MDFKKALEIVLETKNIIMDKESAHNITVKGEADYVTQTDFKVQSFLMEKLSEAYPESGFLAEEKDNDYNGGTPIWIIDPIDGTTNLIHGCNMSAVSLAYYDGKEVIFGAVYNPFTGELFRAEKGKGAFLGDTPIHCTGTDKLNRCLVSVGTSPYYKDEAESNFRLFQKVFLTCEDIRRTGSAALDHCYVAAGRFDIYFERHLKPWDYAAGKLILEEAGGKVTGWQGEEADPTKIWDIVATNGKVHEAFLEMIK